MHKTTRSEPLAPAVGSQFERSVRPRAWLVEDPDPNGPRTFIATQDMEDAYSLATDEAPPIPLYDQSALDRTRRHPTLAECEAAGRGPENYPGKPFEVGGLPATKEERARFEAYMRGHCWDVGHYVDADECYDTTFVRCLWGVWRDRGALPTVWPNVGIEPHLPAQEER